MRREAAADGGGHPTWDFGNGQPCVVCGAATARRVGGKPIHRICDRSAAQVLNHKQPLVVPSEDDG